LTEEQREALRGWGAELKDFALHHDGLGSGWGEVEGGRGGEDTSGRGEDDVVCLGINHMSIADTAGG